MPLVSREKAEETVEKICYMFDLPMPEIVYDHPALFKTPLTIGVYLPFQRTISFRSDFIPDAVASHEVGHLLYDVYHGNLYDEDVAEGFAHFMEIYWRMTRFEFRCLVCRYDKFLMLENGDIQCKNCSSVLGLDFF